METKLVSEIHCFVTIYMVGLIWFVQIVHYPLFSNVGQEKFVEYERLHQSRTTWVVMPPMLVELACSVFLLNACRGKPQENIALVAFILLLVIWVSTFFAQVPKHAALSSSFNANDWNYLVRSNWIRTICWTLRGAIALKLVRSC